jgi:hypothetical protein
MTVTAKFTLLNVIFQSPGTPELFVEDSDTPGFVVEDEEDEKSLIPASTAPARQEEQFKGKRKRATTVRCQESRAQVLLESIGLSQ